MRAERMLPRTLRAPFEASAVVLAGASVPGADSQARRRLVAVIIFIYLLAIFEGSIRKYVVPQFGQYVFFIRDPFLLYVYVLATRHGFWPRNNNLFKLSLAMCALGFVLFVAQAVLGGLNPTRVLLGIHGWRSYCLYVPLAFLMGEQFRTADLMRVARLTLLMAVPIALLVVLQFTSPPGAAINVGVAAEEELQFKGIGLDLHHVRTTGTFTSSAGQTQFVTTACAFLLALLLMPAGRRGVGFIALMVAAGGVLTCVALGGSRGTTIQCALSVAVSLVLGFIGRGAALKARAITLPLCLAGAAIVLYPIVFPTGFSTFMARWDSAARAETGFQGGVFGRALYGFIDFIRLIELVPMLGYGLGYGSNASITLRAEVDGIMPGFLSETDFSRHMVDLGPIFGMGYIAFRVAFVLWLGRLVWMATRRASDPMPLMLFSYIAIVVLLGQITGNGTITAYGWLFAGFCLAAARNALSREPAAAGAARAALPVRPGGRVLWPRRQPRPAGSIPPRTLHPRASRL